MPKDTQTETTESHDTQASTKNELDKSSSPSQGRRNKWLIGGCIGLIVAMVIFGVGLLVGAAIFGNLSLFSVDNGSADGSETSQTSSEVSEEPVTADDFTVEFSRVRAVNQPVEFIVSGPVDSTILANGERVGMLEDERG